MGKNNLVYIIQVLKKLLSHNTLQIEAQEWQNRVLKTRSHKLQKPIEPLFQSCLEISQYHIRKLCTIFMQTGYSQPPRLHFFTCNFKWKHKKRMREETNPSLQSLSQCKHTTAIKQQKINGFLAVTAFQCQNEKDPSSSPSKHTTLYNIEAVAKAQGSLICVTWTAEAT